MRLGYAGKLVPQGGLAPPSPASRAGILSLELPGENCSSKACSQRSRNRHRKKLPGYTSARDKSFCCRGASGVGQLQVRHDQNWQRRCATGCRSSLQQSPRLAGRRTQPWSRQGGNTTASGIGSCTSDPIRSTKLSPACTPPGGGSPADRALLRRAIRTMERHPKASRAKMG